MHRFLQSLRLAALGVLLSTSAVNAQAFRPSPEHSVRWWHCSGISGDWCGARCCLEERGICIEATFTEDLSYNASGGLEIGGTQRYLFDVNATVDLECLLGWCGATLFIDAYMQRGNDGSEKTGDLQAYSNIDLMDVEQVSEVWIEQVLGNGLVRIKVGKVDTNSEFAYTNNGGEFINSSMGFSPTIFVLPSYPDPSSSINVFICPGNNFFAALGIYDGSTHIGPRTGSRGLENPFKDPHFVIGELGFYWEWPYCCLGGRATVGGWHHSGDFDRFDGGSKDGTEGLYATFDHDLWVTESECEDCCQRVAIFAQYGYADPAVAEITQHLGAGIIWEGAFTGYTGDVLGFGGTYARVSDAAGAGFTGDYELALELFYRLEALPCISIKPDLQFIIHPGAMSAVDNALVGTLRIELSL